MTNNPEEIEFQYDFIYVAEIEIEGRRFELVFKKETQSESVSVHIEVDLISVEFFNLLIVDGEAPENLNDKRYRFLRWMSDALAEINPENHEGNKEVLEKFYRHWMRFPDQTKMSLVLVLSLSLPSSESQLIDFLEQLCFLSTGRLNSLKMEVMEGKKPCCWTVNERLIQRWAFKDERQLVTTQPSMSGH